MIFNTKNLNKQTMRFGIYINKIKLYLLIYIESNNKLKK